MKLAGAMKGINTAAPLGGVTRPPRLARDSELQRTRHASSPAVLLVVGGCWSWAGCILRSAEERGVRHTEGCCAVRRRSRSAGQPCQGPNSSGSSQLWAEAQGTWGPSFDAEYLQLPIDRPCFTRRTKPSCVVRRGGHGLPNPHQPRNSSLLRRIPSSHYRSLRTGDPAGNRC